MVQSAQDRQAENAANGLNTLGGAVPPSADLYGLASHDRGLVSAEVGELVRPHRGWWPRYFRA
jgi:hypothetical protein